MAPSRAYKRLDPSQSSSSQGRQSALDGVKWKEVEEFTTVNGGRVLRKRESLDGGHQSTPPPPKANHNSALKTMRNARLRDLAIDSHNLKINSNQAVYDGRSPKRARTLRGPKEVSQSPADNRKKTRGRVRSNHHEVSEKSRRQSKSTRRESMAGNQENSTEAVAEDVVEEQVCNGSDEDGLSEDDNLKNPRIKIKFSVPKPIVAQPAHIPLEPKHKTLTKFLDSFRLLDENEISEEIFQKKIADEASLRKEISNAITSGKISEDNLEDKEAAPSISHSSLRKPFDPPHAHSHRDFLVSHAIYLSKLAAEERRNRVSKTRKLASMIQLHFKRLSGADEKERKMEERRIKQLAKKTAMDVKRKWRLAEKVVRQRMAAHLQEQQRLAGKEQLNTILDHSSKLLEARKDHFVRKDQNEQDNLADLASEQNGSDSENELDSELDMSSDDDSDESVSDNEEISQHLSIEEGDELNSLDKSEDNADASILSDRIDEGLDNIEIEEGDLKPSYNENSKEFKDILDLDHPKQNDEQTIDSVAASDLEVESNDKDLLVARSVSTDSHMDLVDAPKTTVPFLLRGTLREYQHLGLDWLAGLYNSGTNGILADEMGLGKTIQTISLLSYLACEKKIWGPHLIVVPTSVMLNWEMEFKRFAPGFRILTYYGNPAQRKEKRRGWNDDDTWDVCITSYQLVIHDQHAFRRKNWQYMILDEAHNIKNFRSQRWQALLNFKTHRRLLLTGTPLQNNLIELWSLLYFLMPSTRGGSSSAMNGFASLADFQEWFSQPVDKLIEGNYGGNDAEARNTISKLHKVLRPYLLRRLKADVEKQMPAKYEHIVPCKLSKRQRYLYDDFMSRAQTKETLASGNFLSIINCLMQLRKVCNHPDLFEVRPIVTSFAMNKPAISSFEPTELLLRKRLLDITDDEKVNLDFVNFVFTKNESMATTQAQSQNLLSSNELIKRHLEELESSISEAVSKIDYSTVKGFKSARIVQRTRQNIEDVRQVLYVNKFRTARAPIFGSNLIHSCTISIPREKRDPGLRSYPSDKLVMSVKQRAEVMKDVIDHYAFVTPNVVALGMANIVFPGIPKESFLELNSQVGNPMHQVQVKLSIAFPDKRLLQYDCGKLQRLAILLRDLIAGGHRALIFTQMTKVLDILEQFLNIHGYRYMRLDGATKIEQRQIMTERFNTDPKIPVFILSTRSGGLGINLTGADTVIFYDSDWNPSMDKQCQDRCHRIGQTRDVHIYRFVSEHTIESNILRKANQKRMLDDLVIQEGDFTTDYFSKFSLSDMLGTESDDRTSESLDLQVKHMKGGLESALAQAEDEDDARAAKMAARESHMDAVDFNETEERERERGRDSETPGPQFDSAVASTAPTPVTRDTPVEEPIEEEEEQQQQQQQQQLDEYGEDYEDDFGSVDDYMIRFIEQGYYWD
ncbi:SNF2 family N-terminal domain-containing protein [Lipomyces japonicus]|uniref:SNF2 family N-terminal domain-containing protein n=1 Tax=Lipomyces japonicus TaxID=56871 RepID=UPI0034CEFB32